jgi:hypothetical protein
MRFKIAVHAQCGRMRSNLPQQTTLDEKTQIVVDRRQRNRWNAAPDRGVNVFRGIVPVGSDDGLINYLTLVRDRQTVLRSQLTELFMGEAHDYRMIMIIKRRGAVSICKKYTAYLLSNNIHVAKVEKGADAQAAGAELGQSSHTPEAEA